MIYIIDELVLLLVNPFGMFLVMASLLYAEKTLIQNLKNNSEYNRAVHVKIREIN